MEQSESLFQIYSVDKHFKLGSDLNYAFCDSEIYVEKNVVDKVVSW